MESAFCEPIPADCRLIETFRYDPSAGAVDLDLHLNRMCDAARKLGFSFRRKDADPKPPKPIVMLSPPTHGPADQTVPLA